MVCPIKYSLIRIVEATRIISNANYTSRVGIEHFLKTNRYWRQMCIPVSCF